jgi:hypothetical protein
VRRSTSRTAQVCRRGIVVVPATDPVGGNGFRGIGTAVMALSSPSGHQALWCINNDWKGRVLQRKIYAKSCRDYGMKFSSIEPRRA